MKKKHKTPQTTKHFKCHYQQMKRFFRSKRSIYFTGKPYQNIYTTHKTFGQYFHRHKQDKN